MKKYVLLNHVNGEFFVEYSLEAINETITNIVENDEDGDDSTDYLTVISGFDMEIHEEEIVKKIYSCRPIIENA